MLYLMAGTDIPIPELQTSLHQPTIKEISFIGETQYFEALQILCFNKAVIIASNPQGSSALNAMNNFQIFMTLVTNPEMADMAQKKNIVLSVFAILFPKYTAQFLPHSVYFHNSETKHNFILDENTFDAFQKVMVEVGGMGNSTGGQNSNFNPVGEKAAQIAAKLMKGRSRAAQARGDNTGVLARYVSILTIGLNSMSLTECLNLTVYQLYDLIERYGLYISWDLDIRSRLAGGKPDSKPDDWMKNIHN